jgi:hypothetical protein
MDARLKFYREKQKRIRELEVLKKQVYEIANKEIGRLEDDVYAPKIKALEDERDEKTTLIDNERTKKAVCIDAEVGDCSKEVDKVKRIFDLMEIHRDSGVIVPYPPSFDHDFGVYKYIRYDKDGHHLPEAVKEYIEPLEVLGSDAYKYVVVYLIETKKPVNKYAIVIMGSSLLGGIIKKENIIPKGSVYGLAVNFDRYPSFAVTVMEGPDRDELLELWEAKKVVRVLKFQDGAVHRWMARVDEVAVEYESAVELYGRMEWRLAYLRNSLEIGAGFNGNKALREEIRILRTPGRELPLLIGHITQEYPQRVLAEMLKGGV